MDDRSDVVASGALQIQCVGTANIHADHGVAPLLFMILQKNQPIGMNVAPSSFMVTQALDKKPEYQQFKKKS